MKFILPGKVAIVINGRYAGKKVAIVENFDKGNKERPYPHALVVGIERCPLEVNKYMHEKKIKKRSNLKAFIRIINYSHLMPTRYSYELEKLSDVVSSKNIAELTQRKETKKTAKKLLLDRYLAGKNRWFFTKLRF